MKISDLPDGELADALRHTGITFRAGRYLTRLQSSLPSVIRAIGQLYADYPLEDNDSFADFHVRMASPRNLRRWYRPQVLFYFDERPPFRPLPLSQAFPMFEWGMNWCISNHFNDNLIIHAAVVEKDGVAAVLPGEPGAGKSTLCAALVCRGWRLLSDELAMISLRDLSLLPVPRPVSLKNRSIDIIQAFEPSAVIGEPCEDTTKGTVAHMKAPTDSVARWAEEARPAWIILPRYEAGSPLTLETCPKSQTFMEIAGHTFNYSRLGLEGFDTLGRLVDACRCMRLRYSRLDDAIAAFDNLERPR